MRIVIRLIGLILLALAGWLLIVDLIALATIGSFTPVDGGTLWFQLHANSLQLAEPAIARYLHPWLWHPFITTILLAPAFVILAVPGILLLLAARPSTRKRPTKLFME